MPASQEASSVWKSCNLESRNPKFATAGPQSQRNTLPLMFHQPALIVGTQSISKGVGLGNAEAIQQAVRVSSIVYMSVA